MTIEDVFNDAFGRWVQHCEKIEVQVSSSGRTAIDCEAYREIAALGLDALPYIRKAYDSPMPRNTVELLAREIVTSHGLPALVSEIAGNNFDIPQEISGNMNAIEEHTKRWLDEYLKMTT